MWDDNWRQHELAGVIYNERDQLFNKYFAHLFVGQTFPLWVLPTVSFSMDFNITQPNTALSVTSTKSLNLASFYKHTTIYKTVKIK